MGTKNKERLLSDRLEPRHLPTGAWGHTLRRLRDREDDLLDLIDDTDAERAEALLDDIREHHRYLSRIAKSKALLAQQRDARVKAEERVRALYIQAGIAHNVTAPALNKFKASVTKNAGLNQRQREALAHATGEVEQAFGVLVAHAANTATVDHMRDRIVTYVRDQAAVAESASASHALFQIAEEIDRLALTPPPVGEAETACKQDSATGAAE